MSTPRIRRVDLTVPVVVAGVVTTLASFWTGIDDLPHLGRGDLVYLTVFLVAIALGETARLTILTGRETAPMSTAAALGLSLSAVRGPGEPPMGAAVIVSTICLGMVI
ncbi:hypothetical protein XE97_24125, partial [Salmonella enterica subsp. enterica serovar Senftenberg]|nr:hypothetical protein [Salmonella enterica subsp. enterica serovar Senftenberg]